jgi:phosphoribosylanthranilate isomerase
MRKYSSSYFLLDREIQGRGKSLDLEKVKQLAVLFPLFLAGGLTSMNVRKVLSVIAPFAVDVAGGVETKGMKDMKKIEKFIKEVKNYE